MGSVRLEGLSKFYKTLEVSLEGGMVHTPDLLESLPMELCDYGMLLL